MTALDYMVSVHDNGVGFRTIERGIGKASRSEIRRWLNNGSIIINGKTPTSKEEVNLPVNELVLFPRGKQKTTIL